MTRSLRRILAIAVRHAYVLKRSPHRLFDIVIWPAVDVVLFGLELGVHDVPPGAVVTPQCDTRGATNVAAPERPRD